MQVRVKVLLSGLPKRTLPLFPCLPQWARDPITFVNCDPRLHSHRLTSSKSTCELSQQLSGALRPRQVQLWGKALLNLADRVVSCDFFNYHGQDLLPMLSQLAASNHPHTY